MIDIKTSGDLTLLTSDELAGVNGGLLTGSGGCTLPVAPKPVTTSAASAYETSTASHWNWGGPHNVRLTC